MFKMYDEPESPHEGAVFKIYDEPESPRNGASAIVSKELAAKEDAPKLDFPNSLQQKRLQMRLPR